MTNLKPGTRIELSGTPAIPGIFPGVAPEAATIAKWNERVSGPRAAMPRWHIVKFSDGGKLCVHEGAFRVTDNRGKR